MSAEEHLIKAKRALQKANENGKTQELLDIMEQLRKIKATQELLRKTDIGKALGKLRTHSDAAVSQKAKEIVKKWKEDVVLSTKEAQKSTASTKAPSPTPNAEPVKRPSSNNSTPSPPKTPNSNDGPPRTIKTDEVKFTSTGSVPRDKTIELMYSAIALGSYADSELLLKRAVAIESTLFREFGTVSERYKNKVRSLTLNLKSKSNPGLRESVVSGDLSVEQLCKMSVEDMASEEAKARDRKLAEEALFKARGAGTAQAETDMFRCGKCKGRKCTYFQMQTRSADEPMTNFVTCVLCGHHWKFC